MIKVLDTGKIDGGAYRWVKLADGSGRVEEWRGDKWVPGGASFGEFFDSPPVGPEFAAELGIPPEDLMTEREKPKAAKLPEDLTASRLREAINLGVKMAEADALRPIELGCAHLPCFHRQHSAAPGVGPGPRRDRKVPPQKAGRPNQSAGVGSGDPPDAARQRLIGVSARDRARLGIPPGVIE
jgi:hypothetical protein